MGRDAHVDPFYELLRKMKGMEASNDIVPDVIV